MTQSVSPEPAGQPYVGLIPTAAPSRAWTVVNIGCRDGVSAAGYSSAPAGDPATGRLRSREFVCPERVAFWLAGVSFQNKNFFKLVDSVSGEELRRQAAPGEGLAQPFDWDLAELAGRRVWLELEDGDDGAEGGWLALTRLDPEVVAMPRGSGFNVVLHTTSDPDRPDDWVDVPLKPELLLADGIPFLRGRWWDPAGEGERFTQAWLGVRAGSLCVLGCVNSIDRRYGNWGGGDSRENYFIGDRIGALRLRYRSGVVDEVPLIFGLTAWWRESHNGAPAPWQTDPAARTLLDRVLCVANGIAGGNAPYYLNIALRDEPLDSLEVEDNPGKLGYPVILGLTFAEVQNGDTLEAERFAMLEGGERPAERRAWLAAHTIDSSDPLPASRREALGEAGRRIYTYPDMVTHEAIAAVAPEVTAKQFPGPKVRFAGPPEAELLTREFYENATELLARVDTDGMVHESGLKADHYMGSAGYRPGLQPYYDWAFTRQHIVAALAAMGFLDAAGRANDFYDRCLMHFPRSYPEVQLGGKPVPGHWTVVCNVPHVYFDTLRAAGWPTKYTTRDFGNPENDGHGLTMLGHWAEWVKRGRPAEWVEARWEALSEAAEYIPWALDNPELSFSEHGLLYNESEGGMQKASMYCDLPCWLGLLAYAEMAEATGKDDKARRWRGQAERLFQAMEAYYPGQMEPWGEVWEREKTAEWGHAPLAPIFMGMQYWGYDAARALPPEWLARTENTYRMELTRLKPEWCSPTAMGYGHGFITLGALLLDRMSDATRLAEWFARFSYCPAGPHPYRVPESIVMASDGSVWGRRGDLGNLFQLCELVLVIEVLLGIDDLDAGTLKIMPRLPLGWREMEAREWPVRVRSEGESVMAQLSYELKRGAEGEPKGDLEEAGGRFECYEMNVTVDRPVDRARLRIGPYALEATLAEVGLDGRPLAVEAAVLGDSQWGWVMLPGGFRQGNITADAK